MQTAGYTHEQESLGQTQRRASTALGKIFGHMKQRLTHIRMMRRKTAHETVNIMAAIGTGLQVFINLCFASSI